MFDGHGGTKVSKFLSLQIIPSLLKRMSQNTLKLANLSGGYDNNEGMAVVDDREGVTELVHHFFLDVIKDTMIDMEREILEICTTQKWKSGMYNNIFFYFLVFISALCAVS